MEQVRLRNGLLHHGSLSNGPSGHASNLNNQTLVIDNTGIQISKHPNPAVKIAFSKGEWLFCKALFSNEALKIVRLKTNNMNWFYS
jgi:hypothetical protein